MKFGTLTHNFFLGPRDRAARVHFVRGDHVRDPVPTSPRPPCDRRGRGFKQSPRPFTGADKEKGAQALRVKVRECSQMYRPPNPPEKFKTNLSVWLARLKPPRAIWRLCSPHCSPEVNPGDAIARAVLGSVCLLESFPECLARSFSRTKPSRLFRRRHLSKMLTPPGPVITRRSNRKVTKKT